MTLVDPITAAALRTDMTAVLTALTSVSSILYSYNLHLASLADTTVLRDRTLAWTQQDDATLNLFHLRVTDGTASRSVTGTLTVDSGDTIYLGENTVSITETTSIGTEDTRTDYSTVTGTRIRLLRGVRYRMTLVNNSAGTTISGPIILNAQVEVVQRRA